MMARAGVFSHAGLDRCQIVSIGSSKEHAPRRRKERVTLAGRNPVLRGESRIAAASSGNRDLSSPKPGARAITLADATHRAFGAIEEIDPEAQSESSSHCRGANREPSLIGVAFPPDFFETGGFETYG